MLDAARIVVRAVAPAAQDHVAILVAARRDDAREPLVGNAEEAVRVRRGADGVDRDLHVAAGAVLEADRHGQARRQLAVHLAFGRPRADRGPGDRVGEELRA